MNTLRPIVIVLLVVLLGIGQIAEVKAQNVIATPDPSTSPKGILAEFTVRTLANPHAEAWFVRTKLAPAGHLPLGIQPGQTILYVEEGTLTVEAEGIVTTQDGELTQATAGETIMLEVGGSIMFPRETRATLTNATDEDTIFLMFVMFSPEDETGGGVQVDPSLGLVQNGIAVGNAEFPAVSATVVLERVVVEPGDALQNPQPSQEGMETGVSWGGLDLGRIESGSADVTIEHQASNIITMPPAMSAAMSPPEQVTLTGHTILSVGESYAASNSLLTFTNTGEEPLTILRVVVTPNLGR